MLYGKKDGIHENCYSKQNHAHSFYQRSSALQTRVDVEQNYIVIKPTRREKAREEKTYKLCTV